MTCGGCGYVNPAGTKFCGDCGARLAATTAPPAPDVLSGSTRLGEAPSGGTLAGSTHFGAPVAPSQPWTPGQVIDDRFIVFSMLGRGAMGEVYRAFDKLLQTDFALKRLHGAEARLPELAREVAVAVGLSHPNLLRINGLEARGGQTYLVMEYVDGGSLEEHWLAKGRRLPVDEAADLVASVLDGLAVLHARRLVHLDVKPQNVLRSKSGEVKLADYGISRSLRELLSGAGRGAGTPTYMAPEQLRGEVCDGAADVYAASVMLAQLVTGDLPFAATVETAKAWHLDAKHALPKTDSWLDGWLAQATGPKAGDRPTSVALAKALRGRTGAARPVVEVTQVPSGEPAPVLLQQRRVVPPTAPPVVTPTPALPNGHPPLLEASEAGRYPRGSTPVVIKVPAGSFQMGAGSDDSEAYDWERPSHKVTLTRPFAIWSVPVTQAQYEALMKANPSKFKGPTRPVEQVSWFDAVAYCNALSRSMGLPEAYLINGTEVKWHGPSNLGWRLPTEAEWEYACRAGSTTPRYGNLDDIAWFDKNGGSQTHDVGGKKPNAWGLYDPLGNVWEWCWDWYGAYDGAAATDPAGPATGSSRVYRGGSCFYVARAVRAAYRSYSTPGNRRGNLGFRPLRSLA